ncbi:hypothetical protein ACFTRE_17840 [Bacillus subtilis]|uniref:Uncharacterized protein n=3 Tax=Bacillati TaxID=1783272 RepID=A0ABD3ZYW6_BACIU|nr:hypothetical protein [Bacillus subtilis]KIL33473.1 hypothetical protein B4067_4692 [Bacillus subtilis subsp. subtilis]KIN42429.1 hypothetical protein B4070_4301 [Bacillus subtilis]KIN59273.1 hypothetical protein B4145_4515 [Bacillus subtilis]OTQ81718.1 hypothetical protein BG30_22845 [Bacillus subtilis subsp. subtilis]
MQESKSNEQQLSNDDQKTLELVKEKAYVYQQKWVQAEDLLLDFQYMNHQKDEKIKELEEHIEKLEKNLNNLKGPVKPNHKKK